MPHLEETDTNTK